MNAADEAPDPDGAGPTASSGVDRPGAAVDAEMSRRGAVLGWVSFVVELVVAAVLGVLIWYALRLLWESYPYVAAIAAPVVLAGLVTAAVAHPGSQSVRR